MIPTSSRENQSSKFEFSDSCVVNHLHPPKALFCQLPLELLNEPLRKMPQNLVIFSHLLGITSRNSEANVNKRADSI